MIKIDEDNTDTDFSILDEEDEDEDIKEIDDFEYSDPKEDKKPEKVKLTSIIKRMSLSADVTISIEGKKIIRKKTGFVPKVSENKIYVTGDNLPMEIQLQKKELESQNNKILSVLSKKNLVRNLKKLKKNDNEMIPNKIIEEKPVIEENVITDNITQDEVTEIKEKEIKIKINNNSTPEEVYQFIRQLELTEDTIEVLREKGLNGKEFLSLNQSILNDEYFIYFDEDINRILNEIQKEFEELNDNNLVNEDDSKEINNDETNNENKNEINNDDEINNDEINNDEIKNNEINNDENNNNNENENKEIKEKIIEKINEENKILIKKNKKERSKRNIKELLKIIEKSDIELTKKSKNMNDFNHTSKTRENPYNAKSGYLTIKTSTWKSNYYIIKENYLLIYDTVDESLELKDKINLSNYVIKLLSPKECHYFSKKYILKLTSQNDTFYISLKSNTEAMEWHKILRYSSLFFTIENTHYVHKNSKIMDVIEKANPYDKIIIEEGVYNEDLEIEKPLFIEGEENVVIESNKKQCLVSTVETLCLFSNIIFKQENINSENITLKSGYNYFYNCIFEGAKHNFLINYDSICELNFCTLKNSIKSSIKLNHDSLLIMNNSIAFDHSNTISCLENSQIFVDQSKFYQNLEDAIVISSKNIIRIENSNIYNNSKAAITVKENDSNVFLFQNNVFENSNSLVFNDSNLKNEDEYNNISKFKYFNNIFDNIYDSNGLNNEI
jgi:hypothetical protein